MKILLVEDEAKAGDYLRKGLTEAGFLVDWAQDGADVKTELRQAYEQGRLPVVDSQYPILKDAGKPKTREQVKKEMEQSKRSGESERLNQELYSG